MQTIDEDSPTSLPPFFKINDSLHGAQLNSEENENKSGTTNTGEGGYVCTIK